MKRFLLVLITVTSCNKEEVNFEYTLMSSESGIVIANYTPVSRGNLSFI